MLDTSLNDKIEQIFVMIVTLRTNIEKIQAKIKEINKVILKFKQNKLLNTEDLYLTFQITLLTNEKVYYDTIMTTVLEKMYKNMNDIYDKILMLLTSITAIDIENSEEKQKIIEGIQNFRPSNMIECKEVITLSNATVVNLQLVASFIDLFDLYIEQLKTQNMNDNLHCASLTSSLVNRKDHIKAEYTKYRNQLDESIGYFLSCSTHISAQLDTQELMNFLIK